MMTAHEDEAPNPDDAKRDAAAKKTARKRRDLPLEPRGSWPDDVDDVALERALAHVPPVWLLGAFAAQGYRATVRKPDGTYVTPRLGDVPWIFLGKTESTRYGTAKSGRRVACDRCMPGRIDGIHDLAPAWVTLRSFARQSTDGAKPATIYRLGQCDTCGTGYWTEVERHAK